MRTFSRPVSLLIISVMALSSVSFGSVDSSALPSLDGYVVVTTDKDTYAAGETVGITVTIVGYFSGAFSSTCMCFFVVEDMSGKVQYDQRYHAFYFFVLTGLTVPPGETVDFHFNWDQKNDDGNQVPSDNTYKVWGYVAGYNIQDEPRMGESKLISVEGEAAFELSLVRGWNLVSVPFVGNSYNASTLPLTKMDVVCRWDTVAQKYEAYIFGVTPPSHDFAIEGGTGYWIYAVAPETLLLRGSLPETPQYRVIEMSSPSDPSPTPPVHGWALIGFSFKDWVGRSASDIASYFSGTIDVVAKWNSLTQTWKVYIAGVPPSDFPLSPGEGYVTFCSAGTLYYGP